MEKPTLLELFSYIFFYPSCVVGPSFEFSDFKNFIEFKGDYKDIPMNKAMYSALKEFFKAIACIIIFIGGAKIVDLHYLVSEDFYNHNYILKVIFFII